MVLSRSKGEYKVRSDYHIWNELSSWFDFELWLQQIAQPHAHKLTLAINPMPVYLSDYLTKLFTDRNQT